MPFWSDETWIGLPEADIPVQPFDKRRLEEAKYIMAIGEEVYISSSKAGNTITLLKENEAFQLGPGQFAYILTQETVRIPFDAIGFISINARVKFSGLVNISGFHVDPGYHGRLLFSVFNAGPTPIQLRRGQPIFPLWIATLDAATRKTTPTLGYERIDPHLITTISGNYTTAFELDQVIRTLRSEFETAKVDIGALKATRNHYIILIAILTFIFGGAATASLKMTYDWLVHGRPWFEAVPLTPPQLAAPPPAAYSTQSPSPQTAPIPTPLPATGPMQPPPPVQTTPSLPANTGESHG
jgi:dCTP deaminase